MKERIKENINNPEKLEQLYNDDRNAFESGFEEVFTEIRLDYKKAPDTIRKTNLFDIFILISSCLIATILIRIPDIFSLGIDDEIFYAKNAALIVFLGLTIYVTWAAKVINVKRLLMIVTAFMVLAVYVNLLPSVTDSDSVNLVFLHIPLLLWSFYGLIFIDFNIKDYMRRIEYIRYNGDLAILMAIIVISGGILTGITIGLFDAIGLNIENFYMENIAIAGAVSVPIVATYIIKNYKSLTNKIAPVIASIFSPLVLLTAVVFLAALAVSDKDLNSDRDFLLIFNVMLIGVMAVIVFSVSETSTARKQKFSEMILLILSVVTVVIDLIALSAIFYRLGTFGITPNRLAILGSNILILGNLVLLIIDLYKVNFKNVRIREVEITIAKYLPVYLIWILFVVFAFPLIFGMK
jgi:hypothetical protein